MQDGIDLLLDRDVDNTFNQRRRSQSVDTDTAYVHLNVPGWRRIYSIYNIGGDGGGGGGGGIGSAWGV
jgi:hypothetical protein